MNTEEFTSPAAPGEDTLKNQTGQYLREELYDFGTVTGDDDEDEDGAASGSTLIMDKPVLKKPVDSQSAQSTDRPQRTAAPVRQIVTALSISTAGIALMYFILLPPSTRIKANYEAPASLPASAATSGETKGASEAGEKIKYSLGLPGYIAAPQGQLKRHDKVVQFKGFGDDVLGKLEESGCTDISLAGEKVSDQDLERLSGLSNIYMLNLQDAHGFSARGLAKFRGTSLKKLYIDGAGVTDNWSAVLNELPLEYLSLMGNKLSEETFETLSTSPSLKYLKFESQSTDLNHKAFRGKNWLRLPEGDRRVFSFYRN